MTPEIRNITKTYLKTGLGIRFTLQLPLYSGELLTIQGCMAKRLSDGSLSVTGPLFNTSNRWISPIGFPSNFMVELIDVLENNYGSDIIYRRYLKERAAPKKKDHKRILSQIKLEKPND